MSNFAQKRVTVGTIYVRFTDTCFQISRFKLVSKTQIRRFKSTLSLLILYVEYLRGELKTVTTYGTQCIETANNCIGCLSLYGGGLGAAENFELELEQLVSHPVREEEFLQLASPSRQGWQGLLTTKIICDNLSVIKGTVQRKLWRVLLQLYLRPIIANYKIQIFIKGTLRNLKK